MKPVLIQTLIKYNKNRKPKNLEQIEVNHAYGGHKDRSGFIVLLILLFTFAIAIILS